MHNLKSIMVSGVSLWLGRGDTGLAYMRCIYARHGRNGGCV